MRISYCSELACRVYCRVLRKKISSLIKKYSGSSERERRAYEEEPEPSKGDNFLDKLIKELIKKKFVHGDFVYSYYRFLDKFHCEPKDWKDLMEFTDYMNTDGAVHKLITESTKQE